MTNQLPHHHHHHHHHHHQQQRRAVDLRIPAIEKYAYCLCLHVKPTAIFIAVFKLIRALLFASILLNTEFSMSDPSMNEPSLAAVDNRHKSTAAAVNILSRIIMASVSAVAIYAVISGRAALLMPLYAMLLVDFFFALPAFYNRDLDSSLADGLSDFKNYPNNNQYTRYSLMLFSTITMIVKIYFLCVIWKCYRYLRLIELVSPLRLSEIYPHIHPTNPQYPIVRVLGGTDPNDLGPGHNVAPPPYESIASNMKPPNYEEAMKSSNTVLAVNQPALTNSQYQQQQTVVFTGPNSEQQQSISTQVFGNVNVTSIIPAESSTNVTSNDVMLTNNTSIVVGDTTNPPDSQGCNVNNLQELPAQVVNNPSQHEPSNNNSGSPYNIACIPQTENNNEKGDNH